MKKDSTRTGATLCSSMRPRSATTSWLNKFKLLALVLTTMLSINVWGENYTYTKVTSEPTDWSGTYILVYENGTSANICTAGVDAASNYETGTISNGSITGDFADYEVEVATYSTGYSIKALGGTNKGKFLEGKGNSNGTTFAASASKVTTFSLSSGVVTITNNTNVFAYNSANNNWRWRFFKSSTAGGTGYYKPAFYKKASSKKTVNYSGQKSGHFQPSFLAHSQIVIWGFFAFFCKKVFHIRCTKGAYRMHIGSRPSSQPFFSPFGTLFVITPFFLLNLSAACSHPRRGGNTDEAWCSRLTGKPYLGKRMWQLTFTNLLSRRCDGVTETIIQMVTTYVVWIGE